MNLRGEANMDRQRIEACLEKVDAFRASGQKAAIWCEANGVALRQLSSWSAHAGRWRARLDGVNAAGLAGAQRPMGFVAARVAPAAALASISVHLTAGAARLELRWPVAHTNELAAWVRELSR
jgi:hypothetical protein